MTSADECSASASLSAASIPFANVAPGDTAPSMLPTRSTPDTGGLIVAVAIDSNLGLFMPDNGRGVAG